MWSSVGSDTDDEDFKAEGVDFSGDSFSVTGTVKPEANGVLKPEWKTLYLKGDIFYYSGTLVDEYTITGWLGRSVDFFQWQFALKKIPAEYMIYRPRPQDLGLPPPVWPSISAFMSPDARPTATVADRGSMAYLVSDQHADELETNSVDKMEANGDPQENAGAKTDTVSEPEDCTTEEVFIGSQAAANTDGRLTPDTDSSTSTPGPSQFPEILRGKWRVLWRYAISAILHDVRRKWWAWSYFAARRDARKKYLKTHEILHGSFPYDSHHDSEVSEARLGLTSQDARFYEALAVHLSKLQPYPLGGADGMGYIWCSSELRFLASSSGNVVAFDPVVPHHPVSAARFICLECEPDPEVFSTLVTFCDDERCYNSTQVPLNVGVPPHKCMHDSAHDLVKVRTVVHRLAWGQLRWKARDALHYFLWKLAPPDPPPVELANEGDLQQDLVGFVGQFGRSPESDADGIPSSSNSSPRHRDAAVSSTQLNADIGLSAVEGQAGLADGPVRPRGLGASTQTEDQCFEEKSHDGDIVEAPSEEPSEEVPTDTLSSPRSTSKSSASVDEPVSERVTCYVCRKEVLMEGCWYCIECFDFICVGCESRMLISCYKCRKPFPQPRWYYGTERNDFICDTCSAHGVKGPDHSILSPEYDPAYLGYGQLRHVYTHPLVKCRRKAAGTVPGPGPIADRPSVEETETDRRLASVEKRLLAMDAKFERLQTRFDDLEKQLSGHLARLEKKQDLMQDALLEKFVETLGNVFARNINTNVDSQAP